MEACLIKRNKQVFIVSVSSILLHLLNHWIKEASLLTVWWFFFLGSSCKIMNVYHFLPWHQIRQAPQQCLVFMPFPATIRTEITACLPWSPKTVSLTDCLALLKTGVSHQRDEAGINIPTVTETQWIYERVTG